MKTFQPITEILEGADLVLVECSWLQRRQSQFSDPLRGIPCGKEARSVKRDPGTEAREGGQMIINRRVSQPIGLQLFLPGDDIAFETGGDPIVSIGGSEILQKASQVERDFLRHRGRANPGHRKLDVLRDPGFQTVGQGPQKKSVIILHLSGSEYVEISDE